MTSRSIYSFLGVAALLGAGIRYHALRTAAQDVPPDQLPASEQPTAPQALPSAESGEPMLQLPTPSPTGAPSPLFSPTPEIPSPLPEQLPSPGAEQPSPTPAPTAPMLPAVTQIPQYGALGIPELISPSELPGVVETPFPDMSP